MCFNHSQSIHVFTADTLSEVSVIKVSGLHNVMDMVACHDDHQLFMIDGLSSIWRVSVENPTDYEKWLSDDSLQNLLHTLLLTSVLWWLKSMLWLGSRTLSLTSRRLLVTSLWSRSLLQYSTVNKQLLRVIELPESVKKPTHAVETPRGTFVVSHAEPCGVSELFLVSSFLY